MPLLKSLARCHNRIRKATTHQVASLRACTASILSCHEDDSCSLPSACTCRHAPLLWGGLAERPAKFAVYGSDLSPQ